MSYKFVKNTSESLTWELKYCFWVGQNMKVDPTDTWFWKDTAENHIKWINENYNTDGVLTFDHSIAKSVDNYDHCNIKVSFDNEADEAFFIVQLAAIDVNKMFDKA